MNDMTGGPDENEDIPGLGAADRGRLGIHLGIRLDRLTLLVTRRPRLLLLAGGLIVAALAASALAYHSPARAAMGPAVTPSHARSIRCAEPAKDKAAASTVCHR